MTLIPIIEVTPDNIADEHICCAFSSKKNTAGYLAKKQWLCKHHPQGYHFRRLDVRGKAFIEYCPAEIAWLPLDAPGYMVINCFWISGQFKGQGHGTRLLQTCIDDAQNTYGLVAITADKKRPFMSDPKFLYQQGFECVDTAPPFFQLWCKKLHPQAPTPRIKSSARLGFLPDSRDLVAFYTATCPFTEYWTNHVLREEALRRNLPCTIHKITSRDEAHTKLPIPWIINSVFYNGTLLTLEIGNVKQLDMLIRA